MRETGFMDSSFIREHLSPDRELPKRCMLPAIVLLTVLGIGVSVVCLILGQTIVFQNIFYLPILIVCVYFTDKAMPYTTFVVIVYLALILLIPHDQPVLVPALIRSFFFEFLTFVIVCIIGDRNHAYRLLETQREDLQARVKSQTELIEIELEKSQRLEKAYRDSTQFGERVFEQLNIPTVQWNADLYITKANPAFERLIGRTRDDLIGRKLQTLPFLDQAARAWNGTPVRAELRSADGSTHTLLWVFSEIFHPSMTLPADVVGQGVEMSMSEAIQ